MTGLAETLLEALDARTQLAPITDAEPDFGLDDAYAVAGAIMAARTARGERPVGWKIGFTNRTIWDEYGVHAPIWAPMYDSTVRASDASGAHSLDAAPFIEPRIEPEIVFKIARTPAAAMDDRELLGCIDAVGHGFEVVQSLFPGWRFRPADTVAAFGLHGALVHGPLAAVESRPVGEWLAQLSDFSIVLFRDDEEVDRGVGANVLGGPLPALRHFVAGIEARPMARGIEARPMARGIEPGDLVTTGTVTRAFPVAAGETWRTTLEGLPLPGIRLHFRAPASDGG